MSRALLLVLASGGLSGLANAQFSWNNVAGGTWFVNTNWTPVGIPNAAADTATIALAGAYTAAIDGGNVSLGGLTISNPSAVVQIHDNRNLFMHGNVSNAGQVVVNNGGGNISRLRASGVPVTLSGTGFVVLGASGNLDTAIMDHSSPGSFINASGHTIRGTGNIDAPLTNGGIVQADVAGAVLQLRSSAKTNNTTMRAQAGAQLRIHGINITQGVNGRILANGGTVRFGASASVTGGRIQQQAGGSVQFGDGGGQFTALTDVEILGTVDVLDNANIAMAGGMENNGTIRIHDGVNGNISRFRFNDSTTVAGSGDLLLQATGNLDTAIIDAAGGVTGTFGPNQHVHGTGNIDAPITFDGPVSADQAGRVLQLRGGAKTNNATMRAISGGHLRISGMSLSQAPSGLVLADAGTVRFGASASVSGGGISTANGGLVEFGDCCGQFTSLDSVTLSGDVRILDNSNVTLVNATTNDGSLRINDGVSGNTSRLRFGSNHAILGTGEIILQATGNLDTAIIDATGGAIATLGPGQWVRGTGNIDAPIINEGLVSADQNGRTLQLRSGAKENRNIMEAIGGGSLRFHGSSITQTAAAEIVADGGTVVFGASVAITGGTARSENGGTVVFGDCCGQFTTATALTLGGAIQIVDNANLAIVGGLTNHGTIRVNDGSSGNISRFRFNDSSTVDGSGDILLQATANLDTALVDSAGGQVGTIGPMQALHGSGNVYAMLVNDGLISADQGGKTLQLLSGAKTNNATMRAENGGHLRFHGSTITQNGAGEIVADDSAVRFGASAGIAGGVIRTEGSGIVEFGDCCGQFTTATSVSLSGDFRILDNANLAIVDGCSLNGGTIRVNDGVSGNISRFRFGNAGTVSGTGSLILQSTGNPDTAIIDGAGTGPFALGPGITLAGNGRINTSLTVHGTLAPGKSAGFIDQASGTLTLTPVTISRFELGGTGAGQFDRVTGGGPKVLAGTLEVIPIDGHVPTPADSYPIVTGPITGEFKKIIAPAVPSPGQRWRVFYTATSATLQIACFADCEDDGDLDVFDFLCFQGQFALQTEYADCEGDGDWDVFDFLCFQGAFANGCP